jgi:hypothetical protein
MSYKEKLIELSRGLQPGLHLTEVFHDDWCALLNKKGPCDCNPTMELYENATIDECLNGVKPVDPVNVDDKPVQPKNTHQQ